SFGISNRPGVETARAEMDVNYFGLLRLAQELAPAMRSRGADGLASAVAWVNVLSIYALANFPPHGTFSASKAAAHSLAQCLRAVDLTQTLSPEFPQVSLPPEMGQAWPFRIEEVSRYDERGPAWYWNNFSCGEHTGTHFDAPVHWVSGKDLPNNATDSIPPER